MKIYLGADHGGYELKEQLKRYLQAEGHQVEDCGAHTLQPGDDYPPFAFTVAEKVAKEPDSRGILICRSSGGVTVAANKVPGIRAVACQRVPEVVRAVEDDHSNILTLAGDWVSADQAQELVKVFLFTNRSDEERHQRRVAQIAAYEASS